MITTIVTAAPNPVTPIAMRREAEASGRIQPKLMNRDSKVHRFIPPGERASGGVADATERRNALAQMKYRCGSAARCEAGCRNGHGYNIATRRKCASGAGARHLDVPRELDTARRVCGGSDLGKPVPRRDLDPRGRVRRRLPIQRDGARLLPPGQRVRRGPGWRIHELFDLAVVSAGPRERDGGRLRV